MFRYTQYKHTGSTYWMVGVLFFVGFFNSLMAQPLMIDTEHGKMQVEAITDTFLIPYGLAVLPDHKMLVSDRPKGLIYLVDLKTKKQKIIKNLPEVAGSSFGGMMDIALHPDFKKTGWVYFNYTIKQDGILKVALDRAKLSGNKFKKRQRLFTSLHGYHDEGHVGSSIAFHQGYVYFSTGDFYELKDSAQSVYNHLGKIMRLHDDGRIPKDNPFVNAPGAMPEIWSYGHRNPQGLALNPVTDELWEHEHGPQGGDEINRIEKGKNYGWPVICHGIDYDGKPIGMGITKKDGMEQPVYFYVPSIAPCGISFYSGTHYPNWNNNLFIGSLAKRHLNRLVIEHGKIVHEERLFLNQRWRVRSVKQGPDGWLYFGVDNGSVYRIKPALN